MPSVKFLKPYVVADNTRVAYEVGDVVALSHASAEHFCNRGVAEILDEKPGNPDEKPGSPDEKPGSPDEKPGSPDDKPGSPAKKVQGKPAKKGEGK